MSTAAENGDEGEREKEYGSPGASCMVMDWQGRSGHWQLTILATYDPSTQMTSKMQDILRN